MSLMKSQLSDSGALVLQQTVVVFLLLTRCPGGQSQVTGASQSIVAMIGEDVILPCNLKTAVDATHLAVEWARPDLEPRFVHLRRDGVEHRSEENPLYQGRTSLSLNQLKCGDVSLKLSEVKLTDAGRYKCLVPKSGTESMVELTVGSVSSPSVEISKVSSGVLLMCNSAGWYPEPEVLWLDGEGNLLSAGPTVTVEKRHGNSFTCRVQQKDTNQTREAQINVPEDLFMVQTNIGVRLSIFFIVWILSAVAVGLVFWKVEQNRTKTTTNSIELLPLMGGEHGGKSMKKEEIMVFLDNAKAKAEEESEKNEAELKHVEQVIKTLKDQKENLKNQREKLISLQQDDKVMIEVMKKKLKEGAKTDEKKKRLKRETAIKNLEKSKKEHEELMKNIDEMLETTEEMIVGMTERKGKLERDREKLDQQLKDIKRKREEIQKKFESEESEGEQESLNQQKEKTEGRREENQREETEGKDKTNDTF